MNILNDEYLPPLSSGLVVGSSTVETIISMNRLRKSMLL